MHRVLMVSAVFPPQLGGTSEKMAKRVKYFSRFGWHTTILAPAIPADSPLDETLLNELTDAHMDLHRTPYFFQHRWPSLRHDKGRKKDFYGSKFEQLLDMTFVPKGFVRWLPFALQAGRKLAQSVDVILTMNNPVTLHLIGYMLHKMTGKPWVAELRDPIVEYAYGRRGPERLNYWLENLIVKNAEIIIQREDGTPDLVSRRYPNLPEAKFVVIPYAGFDADDFAPVSDMDNLSNFSSNPFPPKALVISYTGSLYGDTITPEPFLKGLYQFLLGSQLPRNALRVIFAGDWDSRYNDLVKDLSLTEIVEYRGRITRPECIHLWQRSHVLLLILGNEDDNLLRIPSKFWDYLGAGRSILALVHPQGRVARLINENRLGYFASVENEEEIATALGKIWQAFQDGSLKPGPSCEFMSLARRDASEKMALNAIAQVINQP